MTIVLDLGERDDLLGTHGGGELSTTTPECIPGPIRVSYVLVETVPYVRVPRRSGFLEHIMQSPRLELLLHAVGPGADDASVLIRGVAEVAEGFEQAVRLVSAFDERFSDLLPPPLPGNPAKAHEETTILRISPSGAPVTRNNACGSPATTPTHPDA